MNRRSTGLMEKAGKCSARKDGLTRKWAVYSVIIIIGVLEHTAFYEAELSQGEPNANRT